MKHTSGAAQAWQRSTLRVGGSGELLFPSRTGGFQSGSSLQKPFANVSEAMKKETNGKFTKMISPKGMRRTSKDLLRAAGVRDLVAMALNSHLSDAITRP
jgi:hypothetical protein